MDTRTDPDTLIEIQRLLYEYNRACNRNLRTRELSATYRSHANRFVLWIEGKWEPGRTVPRSVAQNAQYRIKSPLLEMLGTKSEAEAEENERIRKVIEDLF